MHLTTGLFLAFGILSTWLLAIETSPYWLGPLATKTGDNSEDFSMPLSFSAYQYLLRQCDSELSQQNAAFKTSKNLAENAARCAGIADHAIALMPTYGLAYLAAARASHVFGDDAAAIGYLNNSQKYSPFEGWLAKRRFVFAANQLGTEPASFSLDLANLLTIQSGSELLSGYFVRRPDLQLSIATAAQGASTQDFQRFLNQVSARQAAQ